MNRREEDDLIDEGKNSDSKTRLNNAIHTAFLFTVTKNSTHSTNSA